MKYVNVYLVTRHYGGPEEGGWWYDAGELKESVQVFTKSGEAEVREKLAEQFSNNGRPPLGSMRSTGRYWIQVEDEPGKSWPAQKPHYE